MRPRFWVRAVTHTVPGPAAGRFCAWHGTCISDQCTAIEV